jgi:hypothetical protein
MIVDLFDPSLKNVLPLSWVLLNQKILILDTRPYMLEENPLQYFIFVSVLTR